MSRRRLIRGPSVPRKEDRTWASFLARGRRDRRLAGRAPRQGDESWRHQPHRPGIVGGLVGGFLAGLVLGGDYITGINVTTIVVATVGAVIAVIGYNALRGRRGRVAGRSSSATTTRATSSGAPGT
jgi:predicted lipid-binding transport protein (Tim44 family)